MSETPCILALNAGSSSLKFAVFEMNTALGRVLSGSVDRIGSSTSTFDLRTRTGQPTEQAVASAPNHEAALQFVFAQLGATAAVIGAIGHRVVHGGPTYTISQKVDSAMILELRRIGAFDPAHLSSELALMDVVSKKFPLIPQFACFDTAFHSTLPRVARILPIPRRYEAKGARRYGFHGISYQYMMHELARIDAQRVNGRVILAHLGNGASMAAVHHAQSVDTTMALTPAAGLVMSTRSGDVDPGLSGFLARSEGMTPEAFDHMVNSESGLLGISETSADMRDLLALEDEDIRAAEAVALFCYQAKKCVGAYAAALGGLETIVFAGGIGENAPPVRARICEGLQFLGVEIDALRNAANATVISSNESRVMVRIMHTDEEMMIARSVQRENCPGSER